MFNSKFTNSLKKFRNDGSGNIAMMTALVGTALFASAGVAIDYSRAASLKSEMTQALDAAVLSAGNNMAAGETNKDELRETFEAFFYANILKGDREKSDFSITNFEADPATGKVNADIKSKLTTAMLGIIGYPEIDVATNSSAVFSTGTVEIAIMLDSTGSMRGQKLTDLKRAAEDAIKLLLPKNDTKGVRISLVPYAGSVNIGNYKNRIFSGGVQQLANAQLNGELSQTDTHGARNDCVTERGGRDAATDASYRQSSVGDDVRTEVSSFACPSRAKIVPLTNNKNRLLNGISKLEARGVTAGHLGIAWSYYTLSENWQDLWPTASDPAPYSSDTQKFAILMTDGAFNTYYNGTTVPGDNNSAFGKTAQSDGLSKALCDNMKAKKGTVDGITIYSVAFKAPAAAEKTLRYCATPDQDDKTYYYSADNGAELRAAFREIAQDISRLRISR